MRVVSYGKKFIEALSVDTKLERGDIGICYSDGTAIKEGTIQSFVVMSTVPEKSGGTAIQRGIDINPFNMHIAIRDYSDLTDTKSKIVIAGITNPALKAAEGVVYPADAEFIGGIEVVSSRPYRHGLVENPNPQIIQIPIRIRATDTLDMIVEKIKKSIFMTTYNKELFTMDVKKENDGITITFEAVRETRLTANTFGIIKDQEETGVITVTKTKLEGFLDCVGGSEDDNRYSMINYGWNPHDEWQDAWGLGDAKDNAENPIAYMVISTAEFNQFPEIAADRNSPRKFQIVVAPKDVITSLKEAIDKLGKSVKNGVELNVTNAQ